MTGKGLSRATLAVALAGILLGATMVLRVVDAEAYVYWTYAEKGTIGRATNDGSVVEPNFIAGAGGPFGVAVDSAHIYWANDSGNSIGRANLDGTGIDQDFIKAPSGPDGVAVDASHVYWTTVTGGSIGRAKIDGTGPESEFIKGVGAACGVTVDAGHIYWSVSTFQPGYIGRASLNGMTVENEYVKAPAANLLCGVAVNTTNVFWTDDGLGGGTNVGRANLSTGKGVDESFIGAALGPCGITVFGSQLYWANSGTGTIARANTDSTGVDYAFIHTGAPPKRICGVAVDALAPPPPAGPPPPSSPSTDSAPPQTSIKSGPGKKLAEGKAKFALASSEAHSIFTCKLDGKKPSSCRSPKSYSGLKPGKRTFKVWATDAAGNKDATPAKRGFRVPGA